MSFPGQSHHPHTPGHPPNRHLFLVGGTGCDGYLPKGIELVQAHVFHRHGERAPVRKRLTGKAGLPAIFPLCGINKDFSAAVLAYDGDSAGSREGGGANDRPKDTTKSKNINVRRLTEEQGKDHTPVPGTSKDCGWGELTDLGRQSTLSLGQLLRSVYVDHTHLVPPVLSAAPRGANPVQFRSTAVPRAIESLTNLVAGLFPQREGAMEFVVRQPQDESLYPNSLCGRMRALDKAAAEAAAREWNATLAPLDPLLAPFLNGTKLRIDSSPRANGILDSLWVARAHGMPLPRELEGQDMFETLERAVVHEWFDAYKDREFGQLSMGRLLGDLRAKMEDKVLDPLEQKEKLRLAVYSCHDTSLGGILRALDVFDNKWPPFTSHVAVELLRQPPPPPSLLQRLHLSSPSTPHFVRVRFNGRTMNLPACAQAGKHLDGTEGGICTWDAFKEAVKDLEIGGDEWVRRCG